MWTIKRTADFFGISTNKLRFYEEKGLIHPLRNSDNGYRYFNEIDLLKIQLILGYRELDFPLDSIKSILTDNSSAQSIENQMYNQWEALSGKIKRLTMQQSILGSLLDNFYVSEQVTFNEELIQQTSKMNKLNQQQNSWFDKWQFDNWANTYDEDIHSLEDPLKLFEGYESINSKLLMQIQEEVEATSHLLDIGVGTGNLASQLMGLGYSIIGVDQSRAMLQVCKSKSPKLKVYLGDFMKLPFQNDSFDIAISCYTLHHLNFEQKQIALNEVFRVLRPTSSFYIVDFMYKNTAARAEAFKNYTTEQRNIASDEYFGLVSDLILWAEDNNLKVTCTQFNKLVWMLKMEGL